jgi:hypothetical protein
VGDFKPALALAARVFYCPPKGVDRPRHDDESGPAFDIQIVRRGISPEVLKRKLKMTNENTPPHEGQVVKSYSLTVQLDQLKDGHINYSVTPDEKITEGGEFTLKHHLISGAPMAYLGVIVLSRKLMNQTISEALDVVCKAQTQLARMLEGDKAVEPRQPAKLEKVVH